MEIIIDSSLCCGDKLCTEVCPANYLTMENNKAVKVPNGSCISCGHCIAVCPKQAISMDMNDSIVSGESGANTIPISPEAFTLLAKSRRSVRLFKEKDVPADEMLKALNTARYAPTAKNSQYIKWVVVNNKEKLHEISKIVIDTFREIPQLSIMVEAFEKGADPILRHAPSLVATYCHRKHCDRFGLVDAVITTSYLELLLPLMGLGACWAGFVMADARTNPKIKEILEIPKEYNLCTALMVGYPKYTYKNIPPRKDLEVSIL